MTRVQLAIVIGLGVAIFVVVVGGIWLLASPAQSESEPIPTLSVATIPPNPQLQTRVPLCQQVLGLALSEQGWPSVVSLDPQRAVLDVQMDNLSDNLEEIPAGQIWGVFEAALAGRADGCAGYGRLVVRVGEFRAEVAVADLIAWESGEIDDGVFTTKVSLTR